MKIILFSDIHANLPALESFFEDIKKHEADQIYCLGDLVGYLTWPNEVIREIRKRNIPVIAGNYDYGIGRSSDDCGCAYKTEEDKNNGKISISLTNSWINEENRKYLKDLPAHIRVDFNWNSEPLSLLMVHGSPRKINEYLFEDRDERSLLRIMKDAKADIMCFGHTHKPYHRILEETEGDDLSSENSPRYKHAINLGSVGKPKDGDPRGSYVLLEINEESNSFNPHSIKVEFCRFDYDVELAAKAIEASPLPNDYAEMLRKAY